VDLDVVGSNPITRPSFSDARPKFPLLNWENVGFAPDFALVGMGEPRPTDPALAGPLSHSPERQVAPDAKLISQARGAFFPRSSLVNRVEAAHSLLHEPLHRAGLAMIRKLLDQRSGVPNVADLVERSLSCRRAKLARAVASVLPSRRRKNIGLGIEACG
jgi:hypothetical protein